MLESCAQTCPGNLFSFNLLYVKTFVTGKQVNSAVTDQAAPDSDDYHIYFGCLMKLDQTAPLSVFSHFKIWTKCI